MSNELGRLRRCGGALSSDLALGGGGPCRLTVSAGRPPLVDHIRAALTIVEHASRGRSLGLLRDGAVTRPAR